MPESSTLYLRMKRAVNWLKHEKNMLNKDVAEKMGISNVSFSRGMERIKNKPDDDFVIKFHHATGEIFSLEWLLNGNGEMLQQKNEPQQQPQPTIPNVDFSSYINALLAKCDETIASLHDRLAEKDERLAEKDKRIADLERLADERLHRIAELRRLIDSANAATNYPFPMGVSEKKKPQITDN